MLEAVIDVPDVDGFPDVLVYWLEDDLPVPESLDDARLIGKLAPGRRNSLDLPPEAAGPSGQIVLYSLAHREVLGAAGIAP